MMFLLLILLKYFAFSIFHEQVMCDTLPKFNVPKSHKFAQLLYIILFVELLFKVLVQFKALSFNCSLSFLSKYVFRVPMFLTNMLQGTH